MQIRDTREIMQIENWAKQLSNLTRIAWTGADGHCYFPYKPFTEQSFWQTNVLQDWQSGTMHSWAIEHEGELISHACLVNQGDFFEVGRMVSHPNSPKGTMTALMKHVIEILNERQLDYRIECTQFHNASQKICDRLGLRFAGIGFLNKINNIWWDIIFFDNLGLPEFSAEEGILANPLGKEVHLSHCERLLEIPPLLSTENGGSLPPKKFHVLPRLRQPIEDIINVNFETAKIKLAV
jgi:RimJ/RimL family protein N-acetyltransferase